MSASTASVAAQSETADSRWAWLYRISGIAALFMIGVMLAQIVVFIISPPPTTVIGFFDLFQSNKFLGLLDLDLLMLIDYALMGVIFLGLYVALKRISPSWMAIGAVMGLMAVVIYFASNTCFNMLLLSNHYAAATTDAERTALLGAGQATLATYQGTAFNVQYVLGSIAPIIISAVMLRGGPFGRVAGYAGIVANVVAFTIFVPEIGPYLSLGSVVIIMVWNALIGLKFLQLGNASSIQQATLGREGGASRVDPI
jgi:hypothetical protein